MPSFHFLSEYGQKPNFSGSLEKANTSETPFYYERKRIHALRVLLMVLMIRIYADTYQYPKTRYKFYQCEQIVFANVLKVRIEVRYHRIQS